MPVKLRNAILIIILITPIIYIVSHIGYRAPHPDTDYWPGNQDDSDDYVWVSDEQSLYLVNYETIGALIGLCKGQDSNVLVIYEYGWYNGNFYKYDDDCLIISNGYHTINTRVGLSNILAYTKAPVFTSDGFSVKITDKYSKELFSEGRNLYFTKYKKSDISPSDIGFNVDNWDSILQEVKYYYYVYWDDGKWGDFYFDDYDGTSSEKYLKFKALLDEGKEDEAMKLVDAFGIQGQ